MAKLYYFDVSDRSYTICFEADKLVSTKDMVRHRALIIGRISIGLVASAGLGWMVVSELEWDRVREALGRVSHAQLTLAVVIFVLAGVLRAARWRLLFLKENISVWRLFIVQHEGLGIGNLLPVRVASEIYQLAVLTLKDRVDRPTAVAALGMERIIDAISSTTILCIAFFLLPEMKDLGVLIWATVAFSLLLVGLATGVAWGGQSVVFVQRITFLVAISSAIGKFRHERLRVIYALVMSMAYWILVGIAAWIIAVTINLPISPVAATLVVIGTTFLATAVPAAPGALGTFEFAIVYMLGILGIEAADSFAYAVIVHAVFFLPATLIAVVFLPREGIVSFHWKRKTPEQPRHEDENTSFPTVGSSDNPSSERQ